MKSIFITVLFLTCQYAFGQKEKQIIFPPPVFGMKYPEFISACELPAHKKELVYTRFIYSGVDEYWGLKPEKKCNDINADLDIPNNVDIKLDILKQLKDVHEHYWKEYLIVDVMGTFENESVKGYGHLGSNNSKFTVKYFIAAYTVSKKQIHKTNH